MTGSTYLGRTSPMSTGSDGTIAWTGNGGYSSNDECNSRGYSGRTHACWRASRWSGGEYRGARSRNCKTALNSVSGRST